LERKFVEKGLRGENEVNQLQIEKKREQGAEKKKGRIPTGFYAGSLRAFLKGEGHGLRGKGKECAEHLRSEEKITDNRDERGEEGGFGTRPLSISESAVVPDRERGSWRRKSEKGAEQILFYPNIREKRSRQTQREQKNPGVDSVCEIPRGGNFFEARENVTEKKGTDRWNQRI